jgi:predicted small metal-binding protein
MLTSNKRKGGKKVAYEFACRALGDDCPYVARGETIDEVVKDGVKHGKEVHGYTDEQLNDPEMMEKVKAAIKEV